MLSDKQFEANRANAQKSTGPRTGAGKSKSRLNATRHGLTGQVNVMPEKDREAYDKFSSQLVASLNPETPMEQQLAQSIASFQWRINRAAAIEDGMFAMGHLEEVAANYTLENADVENAVANAKTFRQNVAAFDRLSIYNQRLVSQCEKVMKQLQQLQDERHEAERCQMYNAQRFYKLHEMKKLPFDPSRNGFDLTNTEIKAQIDKDDLRDDAWRASQVGFDAAKYEKLVERTAA